MSRRHRHAQTSGVWVFASRTPLAEAMHVYNAGVALRALPEDPPTPPKESDMNVAVTPPITPAVMPPRTTQLEVLQKAHDDLVNKVNIFGTALSELLDMAAEQDATIRELKAVVAGLTEAKATHREDVYKQITSYLRENVPGVWMTPGTVAANLHLDGKSVAYRLDRMADEGKVERQGGRGSGVHPLYRVVVPPKPSAKS